MKEDNSEIAKFRNIVTSDKVSHIKNVNHDQVEDEVLDAVQEAKDKVIKDELKSMVEPKNIDIEVTDSPNLNKDIEKGIKKELRKSEAPVGEVNVKVNKPKGIWDAKAIADLRTRDMKKQNKTCSACVRRMPLAQMDGGKADICDECK